jgi:ATP-dependent Clp protease ATP-binding subunit ClpC
MTSNLGTEGLRRQPFGFRTDGQEGDVNEQRLRDSVNDALKRTFRPEFLNRIDETIIFHPLTQEQIVGVVALMVRDVQKRLEDRGITFELTPGAGQWLAEEGFDPVFGARPLRRAIQRHLENPLSKGILADEYHTGDHVVVDVGDTGLVLTKAAAAPQPA